MLGLLLISSSCTIIAAAPDGTPPRRIGDQNSKNFETAVPRRGPEAGVNRIYHNFMDLV